MVSGKVCTSRAFWLPSGWGMPLTPTYDPGFMSANAALVTATQRAVGELDLHLTAAARTDDVRITLDPIDGTRAPVAPDPARRPSPVSRQRPRLGSSTCANPPSTSVPPVLNVDSLGTPLAPERVRDHANVAFGAAQPVSLNRSGKRSGINRNATNERWRPKETPHNHILTSRGTSGNAATSMGFL